MKSNLYWILFFIVFIAISSCEDGLKKDSQLFLEIPGKENWKPMLEYTLNLHKRSIHPKSYPFIFEWEEMGPGYCYGTAFGHWDIIHQTFDALVYDKNHAVKQLYNDIINQEPNGLIPGSIWMKGGLSNRKEVKWSKNNQGHPPVWVVAVDDYIELTKNDSILHTFYPALVRQITWFENERKAESEGFYYNDILIKRWESGVDQGVRFDGTDFGPWACIDATSHVYMLYSYCQKWSEQLGMDSRYFSKRKEELKRFINDSLYCAEDKMYYDIWAIRNPKLRHYVFENFWPMIVGAISSERANSLIDDYLLNPKHFFTPHPISTVSVSDPKFELRLWRGPAWNSITYWIARACVSYNRPDAAKLILGKALDATAEQFKKTGTIWEFYHPFLGDQEKLIRKPETKKKIPCEDYLGHNPLIAMADLYRKLIEK